MFNILHDGEPISLLKEFFIPAIHERVKSGKKNVYQLTVPLYGTELLVKRSILPLKHTSFANVITGAVLRMNKLFYPDRPKLKVLFIAKPDPINVTLKFELINETPLLINDEPYFLTILTEYRYDKMDKVSYAPILYRQVCSNGMVSILGERFKETITIDKLFDISVDWSRCSFEQYQKRFSSYLFQLSRTPLSITQLNTNVSKLIRKLINNKRSRRNRAISQYKDISLTPDYPKRKLHELINHYTEEFGQTSLAVFYILTDFASREPDFNVRYQSFLSIGKYVQTEMIRLVKANFKYWSNSLTWEELIHTEM